MVDPITYPARPRQGGPLTIAIETGMYEGGRFAFEPKYNGWRTTVHVPTGTMFNRHNERLSIASEFRSAIEQLRPLNMEWLDCEALERRHNLGCGTLIVLDWIIDEPLTYQQRRGVIARGLSDEHVFMPGTEDFVPQNTVILAPSFTNIALVAHLWTYMQQRNQELGCTFYEGLVAKEINSEYPIQLRSDSEEFSGWTKHRFTTR